MASLKDKYLENAQKALAKGQYDRAIKEYQSLLQLDPDIRNRQRLAEVLVKAGERDRAVEEYKTISRYYADNQFLLKSIAVLKQVQKLVPDDVNVTLNLAELNHKQGLTGNCLTEYQAALAYYEKRHNLIDAVSVLERMQSVDPENLQIRITLAERRFSIGKKEEAYEDFRSVADAVRQRGDEPLLRQITERIQTLFPDRGQDPLAELAGRLKAGDAAGVIPRLLKMAETSHGKEVTELLLEASRRAGDRNAFRTACQLAILQDPDNPGPRRGLLGLCVQEQGGEAAVALLEQWSADMQASGQIQLLQALCREALSAVDADPALSSRLAILDPSLAPPPLRQEVVPQEILPAPAPGAEPAPVEFSHCEEDLALSPEEAAEDHEDFLELELMEEHTEGEFLLEEEAADQPTEEGMVAVTLSTADLSLQKWAVPETVRQGRIDDLPVVDDILEVDELEVVAVDTVSKGAAAVEEAEVFSADDLDDFGDGFSPALPAASQSEAGSYEIDGLFNDFKRSVDSNVDEGDTETHFNLGIAYKEMGLLDDAIQSFAAASTNPDRRIDSIVLQAACYVDKGDTASADRVLRGGLAECADGSEAACVLQYELAVLCESRGDGGEALELFEKVRSVDPFFRDVSERIALLGGQVDSLELVDVELVDE